MASDVLIGLYFMIKSDEIAPIGIGVATSSGAEMAQGFDAVVDGDKGGEDDDKFDNVCG